MFQGYAMQLCDYFMTNYNSEKLKVSIRKWFYKIRGLWIIRHLSNNRYIYITLIFIGVPVWFYWWNFEENGISHSTDNWGTFGDYIGGCCSLILAFIALIITRKMDKKDRKDRKREEAAEEIYEQIQKIKNNDYDARHVNKLRRETEKHRLYLSEDLYNTLMRLSDYFLRVSDNTEEQNPDREEEVILRLKCLYNE